MFPDFGGLELLLILVVSLLVLGPERLPEAARSLAKFLAKWRLAFNRIKTDIETEIGMEDIRRELHNDEVKKEIGRIEAEVSERDKVGNKKFSDSTLKDVIYSEETRWYKFWGGSDKFDQDRLNYDKDVLKKYYFGLTYRLPL